MKNNLLLRFKLRKKMRGVEKDADAFISRVLHANFNGEQHSMKVEGDTAFTETFSQTYDELEPLVKADLADYWKIEENGRPNSKRRNLLR